MQVHQDHCPNCSELFYFPLEYPGEQFWVVCPHCHVRYSLKKVEVDDEYLGSLLHARRTAPLMQKPDCSMRIFSYLATISPAIRFAQPTNFNAIVFLLSQNRSAFPLAVYFEDDYHLVQPLNRLLFTVSLSMAGGLLLLAVGLSLVPVAIGTVVATGCFYRFTALPKVKGATRKRLEEEQHLLKQCYEFQHTLDKICEARRSYQELLKRQKAVLRNMMQTPEHYSTQVDLYQRALSCTEDYLKLCDRAIEQYEAAIRSICIQIETSKLAVELPSHFIDPRIEFGLDQLKDQFERHVPPNSPHHDPDPNNYSNN